MPLLETLCTVLVASATGVCLYHLLLALVAVVGRKRRAEHGAAVHSFAVVIPAHNEEGNIEGVLRCCAALDYPRDKYKVYVVADNCTDRTAEKAAALGAVCIQRRVADKHGKGYALEWAFDRILPEGADAVVVLDADCSIGANCLRIFDRHLQAGDRVIQANYVVANPDDNAMSYVLSLASLLENDLFYAPKSILGGAVTLQGTGMVFHREVLARHPWRAGSIVEDAEYAYQLIREGIRIRFVPNARVYSDFPTRQSQLATQRTRWISGNATLGKSLAMKLIWKGILRRRLLLIDAGLTMLLISRPLIALHLLLTLLLTMLCWWLAPGAWSAGLLAACLAIAVAYALYVAAGVVMLGITPKRVKFLLCAPMIVLRYVALATKVLLGPRPKSWHRTPRLQAATNRK